MPRSAADHATHDELLIARLYGGDVDDRERARALELVAGCEECAALSADLGAIADATAVLPVPARPRDFALTEEDAARLRARRGVRGRLLGIGRRRSIGGALVALGFSGLVLTSALSIFGTVGTSASLDAGAAQDKRFAAAATAAPAPNNGAISLSSPVPAAAATSVSGKTAASAVPANVTGENTQGAAETTASTAAPSTPELPPAAPTVFGPTATPVSETFGATVGQSGPDPKPLILAGSAAILVLGLLVLLVPVIRRRSRGAAGR
jgi:hypothetical protein